MKQFFTGATYLWQGLHLMTKPGLRRFVIIPLLVNALLFIAMFFALQYGLHQLNNWLLLYLSSWLTWLSVIIWIVFIIGFFGLIIFTFMTLANLIAAPFNSVLSEKIAWHLTGTETESLGLLQNIKDIPRAFARQGAMIFYYLPRAFALLFLYFIPIIQAAAAVILFLFHAYALSLTYLDYPMDNHRISFQTMRLWVSERRVTALGFGAAVLALSLVPILNFIVMPAAVAGATKWWIDEYVKKAPK